MTALYIAKGWDPVTAVPVRERLDGLDFGWAADFS